MNMNNIKNHNSSLDTGPFRTYKDNELVRIASPRCKGCGKCCKDMGESIRLDPYDIHLLTAVTERSFDELLQDKVIGLHVDEGIILPHMAMREKDGSSGEAGDSACYFLGLGNECTIHDARPGMCRLFPLGRNYRPDGDFDYFLVENACDIPGRSKVRISDWLGIRDLASYTAFVSAWHGLLGKCRAAIRAAATAAAAEEGGAADGGSSYASAVSSFLLKVFYQTPFPAEDKAFYEAFRTRLAAAEDAVT